MKFCKCRIYTKIVELIVYLENSYKNPFDRKSPSTCGSSFQSSRQVGVLFCLRTFHDFASSQFVAIFNRILRLRHWFLLCFGRCVEMGGDWVKAKLLKALRQQTSRTKYHTDSKSLTTFLVVKC